MKKHKYGIRVNGTMQVYLWDDDIRKMLDQRGLTYEVLTDAKYYIPQARIYLFETTWFDSIKMGFKLGFDANGSFMKNAKDVTFLEWKE